ncbi:Hypothetical protein SCF082_LOCUS31107, partial [Durusdinium trenchii]
VRRYTSLLRELDHKSAQDMADIQRLQQAFLERAKEEAKKGKTEQEREERLRALRQHDDFKALGKLRASLKQKIAEKQSVADQIFDMSEQNLKRLRSDIKNLEDYFRSTGEIPDDKFKVGRYVAAWIDKDSVWILAKVIAYSPQDPDRVRVADADSNDASSSFVLPSAKCEALPLDETFHEARSRLSSRGRKVLAMYPDTTTFYKGAIVSVPFQESSSASASTSANTALFAGHPPGTILCGVMFDDDVDALTGKTPKHFVPTKYVFVAAGTFNPSS